MTGNGSEQFPTIGILGGGQLGRMTALAGIRMGLNVRFLAPKAAGPMAELGVSVVADWTDPEVLRSFASQCTVITVESEWAPADIMADVVPSETQIWPAPDTLKTIRDKGLQKKRLKDAGLPVPDFENCSTIEEAFETAQGFGYPVLLKKFRGSYDGYGNETVNDKDELAAAWPKLADEDGLMVEAWVPFARELAVLVARRPDGKYVVYPVVVTEQRDHRCHAVEAPAPIKPEVIAEAERIAVSAVETVNGIGITAVELFELPSGKVLINELAPRPHNTGHYTIEACFTSQFENHIRGILGWPLGNPGLRVPAAAMVNILGHREGTAEPNGLLEAFDIPDVSVHIYGKPAVRPRRKMGHVTVTGSDPDRIRQLAEQAASVIRL